MTTSTWIKTFMVLFAGFVVSFLSVALLNLWMIGSQSSFCRVPGALQSIDLNPDSVVVLGAGVKADGQVSLVLRDRLDTAVFLLNQYPHAVALVTGDHGTKTYDEVNTMRKYLIAKGIPDGRIFMDHAGFNTYDSMYRAKAIFCIENPLIVTQKYHLPRALFIARSLGMNATGVIADQRKYSAQLKFSLREIPARFKDYFQAAWIKPLPKYLGTVIPVQSASAEATRDGE